MQVILHNLTSIETLQSVPGRYFMDRKNCLCFTVYQHYINLHAMFTMYIY